MNDLDDFITDYNHMWVGCGSYYLYDYNFALNWVTLKAHEGYPDNPNKWLNLYGSPLP